MSAATAVNVRRLGLVIETVCLLALLSIFRKNAAEPQVLLGVPVYQYFRVGLGIGLCIWIVGTIAYRRARQKESGL